MKEFDKASYRNKGGILQKLITFYKLFKYQIKSGKRCVIKHNVDFSMTDNAYLELGNDVIIQDYAWFPLTKSKGYYRE